MFGPFPRSDAWKMHRFVVLCLLASLANAAPSIKSLTPRTECGAVLTGDEGTFETPNYPDLYPANVSCEYIINADNQQRGVRLTFADFSTEEEYDYVEIRDGDNSAAPLIRRLSGELDVSNLAIKSTGPNVYVVLKSDKSVRSRGFSASYASVCANLLTADHGGFSSPNFPSAYDPDLNLCWGISVSAGSAVKFDLTSFRTSPEDVLTAYDGASEAAPVIGTASGNLVGSYEFVSTGNNIFITFTSDSANADEGFVAYYKEVCGNRFAGAAGTITSPNYPADYPANSNFCYAIDAAADKKVQITFSEFVTEPSYDSLAIYDGDTADAPLLARLSGGEAGTVITSTGNSLFLVFTSDSGVSGAGFVGDFVEV